MNKSTRIVAAVKDKGKVTFEYTQDGSMWYSTRAGELFEVPFEDTKGARFEKVMPAAQMITWMRRSFH